MAEILEAILDLQIGNFTAGLQTAAQQVTAFAQAIQGSIGSSAQAFQQQVQQINQVVTATKQAAEATVRVRKQQVDEETQLSRAGYMYRQAAQQDMLKDMLANEVRNVKEAKEFRETTLKTMIQASLAMEQKYHADRDALQKAFFANTQGMEKERLANQQQFLNVSTMLFKERLQAQQALQKDFFTITVGMEKEATAAKLSLQRDFFTNYTGMIKEFQTNQRLFLDISTAAYKQAFEQQTAAARQATQLSTNFYKQMEEEKQLLFRQTTQREIQENNRRLAEEKRAANEILKIWTVMESERDVLRARAQARVAIQGEVQNLQGDQGIRNLTGTGMINPALQQELFRLQGFVSVLEQATPKAGMFENALGRIGTSLKTLGGYFAASFIIGIPFAIAAWGKEAVQTAMNMQSLEATFRAITGSTAKANAELGFLRATANRVGVDFFETANQFKNFEAASRGTALEGAKTRQIFEAITTTTRVMGLSSEQSSRALLAMEQMMSKGTVTSEELRKQLSQAIPGAVGIMARALGVGTDELGKMMKNGELLSSEVLPKFAAQLQKEFGPGLEQAAKTAQATFARLGNEIQAISVQIGTSLLRALQPAADFLAKLMAAAREAGDRARKEAARAVDEALGGKPIAGHGGQSTLLEKGATEGEMATAMRIGERAAEMQKLIREAGGDDPQSTMRRAGAIEALKEFNKQIEQINDTIRERIRLQSQEDAQTAEFGGKAAAGTAILEAQAKQKKHVQEFLDLQKQLPAEMQKINALATVLPTTYEKAEERLRAVEKVQKDYLKLLEADPNLRLNKDVQGALGAIDNQVKAVKAEVDARKEKERLEKEEVAAAKRRRAELKADEEQRAREEARFRDDAAIQIARVTEGETAAKLVALDIQVRKMRESKLSETVITEHEAAKRIEIYKEEYLKSLEFDKGYLAEIKGRSGKQEEIEKLLATTTAKITKTAVDDYLALQADKLTKLEELGASEIQMEQFKNDTIAGAERIANEETEKLRKEANREAEKSWKELGNTIENALAGAFQSVLSGSKNLFEGIRDAFLKILTRMAADALTSGIIIPALVKFIGGGGGGGGGSSGSTFGAFSNAIGLGDGTGTNAGGGGGASGTLGTAIGMAASANTISGALGGPSVGIASLTGGVGAGLMATELGFLPGIGTAVGGVGPGMVGPGATALATTSLATIASGIGAGVAAGMLLKQFNNFIGVKGMAGSALAGAGGGALAGTIILPGIGTAIGAVVGAIGGILADVIGGKKDRTPGFDIKQMQPGQINYDNVIGLHVTENFKILADMHERLGTDYEDFVAKMDESINGMFESVVSQVQSAPPDVQRALVAPLNQAFNTIAQYMAAYPKIEGENFQDDLEKMMTAFAEQFENTSTGAIQDLIDAVKKITPVVEAFSKIIDHLLDNIHELESQQLTLDRALQGNIITLRESLMSPAQLLGQRKEELRLMMEAFTGGDEAAKIGLAPRIGELTTVIMELSKSVLSQSFGDITGVQGGIKTLMEALYTPAQTLAARQADLNRILSEFRSGTDSVRAVLAPQLTALALQIMELTKEVNTLAEQQALIADFPMQMRAITEALFSPAQSYLSERQQLTELMNRFRGGTAAQQIELEPQIAQLAAQIMGRAKGEDVLGQDPQLLRQTQSELLAVMQEVQGTIASQANSAGNDAAMLQATLERTQAEMVGVLREVEYTLAGNIVNAGMQTIQAIHTTAGQIISTDYAIGNGVITAQYYTANGVVTAQYGSAGQLMSTQHYIGGVLQGSIDNTSNTVAGWSNALYGVQAALIGQVASVRDSVWQTYNGLIGALWYEIGLAQYEIGLLTASLNNLQSVDAAVARALGVLGEMNMRLGNPLNVNMGESIATALQRDTIYWTSQLFHMQRAQGTAMIAALAKPAFGLEFWSGVQFAHDFTGYQHGGYIPRNMTAQLHQGERVIPEWDNRGGGGKTIAIQVYGGSKDAGEIADMVIQKIESKSGRLQSTTIQTSRR